MEINFSFTKSLYKVFYCAGLCSYHVIHHVKQRGRNNFCLNYFYMWVLSLRECLLKILECFLIVQESHEPELKIICSDYFYVLL